MNRSIILPALVTAFVALSPAGVAVADNPHDPGTTGQPNKSIEEQGLTPTPGFGTGGFEVAEAHYAGEDGTASALHSQSGHAVSQYDVAGFQFTNRGR
jgi:hypothetical protein